MDDAVAEAAVGRLAALERPRDAHELALDGVPVDAQRGVAVAAHVEERQVRREVRVRRRARALAASPVRWYSRQDRTPWCSSRLTAGCCVPPARSATYSARSGWSLGKRCSNASTRPGAETEPVMNATPTGSNGVGRQAFAARPAQKLCRSPDTVTKPVIAGVAHGVVDLAALGVGGAVVAAAAETRRSPRPATACLTPAGRFCGSARQSSVPSELPQTFQVAVDARSRSRNQAFCSAPRMVCGGAFLRKFGTSRPPKRIVGRRRAAA